MAASKKSRRRTARPWRLAWPSGAGGILGVAMLVAGSLGLAWHPWGLLLLLGGTGIFFASRWGGAPAAAESTPARPKGRALPRLAGAGIGVTLFCGALLAFRFRALSIPPEQWPANWILALLALGAGLMAAYAFPTKARFPALRKDPPFNLSPRTLIFWAACLLVVLGCKTSPWRGVLGFAVVLLAASHDLSSKDGVSPRFPLLCLLIGALGLWLHLWRLIEIPQGLNWEEYQTMVLSGTVKSGEAQDFTVNSPEFTGVTLYHHVVGWVYRFLGAREVLPLRWLTVLGWLVLAAYGTLLAAGFFSWTAAVGAAAFFSFSFFPMHYGRMGFYYIWAPAACAGALAHGFWSLKSPRGSIHLVLAAFWCAAAAYGWIAGFVAPALLAVMLLAAWGLKKENWRPRLPGLLCATAVFLALSAPAIQGHLNFPGGLSSLLSGSSDSIFSAEGDPSVTLSSNLSLHLNEILRSGTQAAQFFLPGRPFVPAALLFFVAAGLGILMSRPWSRESLPILAACFLGFLPAWISDPEGRNPGRLIVLLLPLGVLFGLGWSAWLRCLKALPFKGAGPASMIAGMATLAFALGREPILYFKDYREDPRAIKANFGPLAHLARAVSREMAPGEAFFYSDRFYEARSFSLLLPEGARMVSIREAPDFFHRLSKHPQGAFLLSPLFQDWIPWLSTFAPDMSPRPIENPWEAGFLRGEKYFQSLGSPDALPVLIRWSRRWEGSGFQQTAPGRWKGFLWVARPDYYEISLERGRMILDGKEVLRDRKAGLFWLSAVPYPVRLEGQAGAPAPKVELRVSGRSGRGEWGSPFFKDPVMHGLRKTLSPLDGGQDKHAWVSLAPVLAQRFHSWSYEEDESPIGLPVRAEWEGSLRVPQGGTYRFSVPNSFKENLVLRIGDEFGYKSLNGNALHQAPLTLRAGKSYPIRISAERVGDNSALRFLVEFDGQKIQPVPSSWLSPAPLPPPLPLSGNAHGKP